MVVEGLVEVSFVGVEDMVEVSVGSCKLLLDSMEIIMDNDHKNLMETNACLQINRINTYFIILRLG